VDIRVLPGYESKGVEEDVQSLVRRDGATVQDALHFTFSARTIVRITWKLLNIDSVIGGFAAMGDSGKGAPGFLSNIIAHGGEKIYGLEASGKDGGIGLGEPFRAQV
jgi:hypothetical protein